MSSAAKVGAFMLIILAILGYFVLKIEDVNIRRGGGTKKVTAVFDSVAGLDNKSAVRVAGVRVGKVANIKLRDDGKAEVTMELDRDVKLHQNASAHVANLGLLGEKYIELEPGTASAPLVPDEQQVTLRGSQPATIDDVTNQVSAIATDVKAITASLRTAMGGPDGQQRLVDIVENVRQITAQVRELIAANRTNVDATLANARDITAQLKTDIPRLADSIEKVANQLNGTIGENRSDVHQVVGNLRDLSRDLRTTADNLNSITGQVKSGEGTVGKLVYSNETHDKLTAALSSVESGVNELKTALGRANRIGLDLGMKADYYAGLNNDSSDASQLQQLTLGRDAAPDSESGAQPLLQHRARRRSARTPPRQGDRDERHQSGDGNDHHHDHERDEVRPQLRHLRAGRLDAQPDGGAPRSLRLHRRRRHRLPRQQPSHRHRRGIRFRQAPRSESASPAVWRIRRAEGEAAHAAHLRQQRCGQRLQRHCVHLRRRHPLAR